MSSSTDTESTPSKRGKKKVIYGIDSNTWYSSKKASPEVATELRNTNMTEDYENRKAVYVKYRKELANEFKTGKRIPTICKGFWKDQRHLGHLFSHMTRGAQPLNDSVAQNFNKQISK